MRLATGRNKPEDIALDSGFVYFTDLGDNTVWRVAKDGTGLKELGSNQATPFRIAVDDSKAYWTSQLGGAVLVVDKAGASSPTLFASANRPSGISVDASNVFWASDADNAVYRQSKTGGSPALFAKLNNAAPNIQNVVSLGPVTDMVGTTTTLYLSDGHYLEGIDKSTGNVTFSKIPGSAFLSPTVSLTGYLATVQATNQKHNWFQSNPNFEGDPMDTEVENGAENVGSMVTDGCTFYFGTTTQIERIRWGYIELVDGALATTVFRSATAVRRLALDADALYWTDAGYVGRIPR